MSNASNTDPRVDNGCEVTCEEDGVDDCDRNSSMSRSLRAKPWHRSKTRSILIVLWTVFTICLGIMLIVIFVQPQWLGGTSPHTGAVVNFGLYRQCSESWRTCSAKLAEFSKIPSTAWKTSTVLVALSICAIFLSILVVAGYWLACRERTGYGFPYATGLQAFSALCLFLTCVIYPSGWNASEVTAICGQTAGSYKRGNCEVKWAYWIAIISMIDALVLSVLSFFFIEHKVVVKPLESIRRNSFEMNGKTNTKTEDNLYVNTENTAL